MEKQREMESKDYKKEKKNERCFEETKEKAMYVEIKRTMYEVIGIPTLMYGSGTCALKASERSQEIHKMELL